MLETMIGTGKAISVFALAGLVAACGWDMPELREETKFDQPALSPAESEELIQILNARRHGWDSYYVTTPGGSDAMIRFQLPAGNHATIIYYTRPAEGSCSMIVVQGGSQYIQSFPPSICGRLDNILTGDSRQSQHQRFGPPQGRVNFSCLPLTSRV